MTGLCTAANQVLRATPYVTGHHPVALVPGLLRVCKEVEERLQYTEPEPHLVIINMEGREFITNS